MEEAAAAFSPPTVSPIVAQAWAGSMPTDTTTTTTVPAVPQLQMPTPALVVPSVSAVLPGLSRQPRPAWYTHYAAQYALSSAAVFVASFVILVAMKPAFTMQKPRDTVAAAEFSAGKAAGFAAGAALVALVIVIACHVFMTR